MDKRARVEQSVFDFLRPQLKQYREHVTDLARAAAGSMAKVSQHADDVVAQRRRELKRAQDALESCQAQEGANCSGYYREVQRCQQALQRATQGRELIQQACARFRHAQNRHDTTVDQLLIRGEKIVRTADDHASGYQKSSAYSPSATLLSAATSREGPGLAGPLSTATETSGGGAGNSSSLPSWQRLPGVSMPTSFPDGFALIPITMIANDNPVTSTADFDTGQNVGDLRWSSEALLDVVLPAMSKIDEPKSYLDERDRREGRSGDRSYGATYSGYFSAGTAIRLEPLSNGTFDLVNGRHRLWLLSRAGAEHVPALIGGGAR